MADRYWVGGAGTWDGTTTTNWATSSGVAGGASAPTAADTVIFDNNSNVGTGTFIVTVGTTAKCLDMTFGSGASALDGAMTLAFGSTGVLTVSGTWTNPATNFSTTGSGPNGGALVFNAATTGKTITTNGVTITANTSFQSATGGWTLGSAFTNTGNVGIAFYTGTLDTGGYNMTVASFQGSGVKTFNLNNSTITTTGTSYGWSMSGGLTVNSGTSQINSPPITQTWIGNGQTYNTVVFTGNQSSTQTISGANTFINLTFPSRTSVGTNLFAFSANQTITGTFIVGSGTASAYRTFIASSTVGTTRTLTCASIAAMTDVDFRDITIAGAHGTLSGTRLGDCKGNSGITFGAAKTVYYGQTGSGSWGATGSGSWSATSGGALDATQFPLAQDTAVFPAATYPASGSTTTINAGYQIGTIDMSLRTSNTMTLATGSNQTGIYGNWTNGTGITISGTDTIYFLGRITQTITSAGRSFSQPIEILSPSGIVQLQDAFTTSNTFTYTAGTINLNAYKLTVSTWSSDSTTARTLAFNSGSIDLTGTGTIWSMNTGSNMTVTGTSVINCTNSGSVYRQIYNRNTTGINFNITAGTGQFSISSGSFQYNNIDFTGFSGSLASGGSTASMTGNLTLSSTMTVDISTFVLTLNGTSGVQNVTTNAVTINLPITLSGTSTKTLQGAMTMGNVQTLVLNSGTLDLNNYTLSTGLFNSSGSSTRTIAFGTGNITCTGVGTVWTTATTTSLTTTGTQVVNVTSAGSTAITVATGALSEANSISYNFTGGTYALTFLDVTNYSARNVNFTGFSGTLGELSDPSQAPVIIYGDLTLSATMTLTASTTGNGLSFRKTSGTSYITTNAKVIPFIVVFNGLGGTFVLQDNLTTSGVTSEIYLNNGTLNLNGKTLTPGSTFVTGTGTKNLTFNGGTLVCSLGVSSAFNNLTPTGFTTTAGTGVGTISMTAATAKTFVGGGSTFNCTLNQGGLGALTITGSNTFKNITNTVQPASVLFTAATTNTFTNFSLSGTAGNLVTVGSVTAASHTLSAVGTVSADYLSISQSTAAGGAGWYAGANSTDGGNNTGWVFTAPPAPTYSISNPAPLSEGQIGSFSVLTTNIVIGTTLYWTIASNAGDFATASGSFPVVSQFGGFFNVTPTADLLTEGTETFFVQVRTGSTSGTVVATSTLVNILDTSLSPPPPANGNFLQFF